MEMETGQVSGIQVDNLAGLRPRHHSFKVGVLTALGTLLLALGVALNFTLLLVLLLLSS